MVFSIAVAIVVFICSTRLVIVQATPVKIRIAARSANDTFLTPRLNGGFRIRDCSETYQNIILEALVEAQQVVSNLKFCVFS
jgi:hypothetical protein